MSSVQFTALVRVPFARGEFVEPPQVSWDAAKDRSLWKVVSKSSKASDLNWVELADNFNVPPSFLLQQAAWLYERHLDHVRAQLKKVGGAAPSSLGLDSTHTAIGGIPMQRGGSNDSRGWRPPSTVPVRTKESPAPPGESSMPAPPLSRTPSTNTITQSRALPPQQPPTRQPSAKQPQKFELGRPDRKKYNRDAIDNSRSSLNSDSVLARSSSSDSSSLSDEDDDNNPARRSQLFKRPPRFRAQKPQRELAAYDEEAEEEDDHSTSTGTTLPFAKASAPPPHMSYATSSTARVGRHSEASKKSGAAQDEPKTVSTPGMGASSSVASSISDAARPGIISPGPLSPAHRASIAKASPRGAGQRSAKEGSEGTPSMGSSFSDIDDTSISQSALEEALLSNIQHGRMSTLSQLRSRYL